MGTVVSLTERKMQRIGLAPSVVELSEETNVEITNWFIKRTNQDSLHIIGDTDDGYRVSSPIIEYDAKRHLARTVSGRYYAMIGPATEGSENARLMWNAFMQHHGLHEV